MPFFLKLLFSVMGIHWSHSKNFWNYSFLWPTLEDLIILDYGLRVFNIPKELSPAAKFKAIVQALFTILQSPKSPEGGKSHAWGGGCPPALSEQLWVMDTFCMSSQDHSQSEDLSSTQTF